MKPGHKTITIRLVSELHNNILLHMKKDIVYGLKESFMPNLLHHNMFLPGFTSSGGQTISVFQSQSGKTITTYLFQHSMLC